MSDQYVSRKHSVVSGTPAVCVIFSQDRPREALAVPFGEHRIGRGHDIEGLPSVGELLLFRANARVYRWRGSPPKLLCWDMANKIAVARPLRVQLRFWLQAGDEGHAEWQTAETNAVLSGGAGVDSGIRVMLREIVSLREPLFRSPGDLGCLRAIARRSMELDTVDVYLHRIEWPCRACPTERRIFLSLPRLTPHALAHEFLHLLGMPECAHVDENAYLDRGNVMDRTPLGGVGKLTIGQLCIMNLSQDSLAAQLRSREEPGFEMRCCLDEHGEPVDAPSLGLHVE